MIDDDRKLLELAAKAAGLVYDHRYGIVFSEDEDGNTLETQWNPLNDDGDALRLAVKLNMGISIPVMRTPMADVITFRDSSVNIREQGTEIYAATRRAIVRAAAATVEGVA